MEDPSNSMNSEVVENNVGTQPQTFYLKGKLASEIPWNDKQPSASLYRAVCDRDLVTVKYLLGSGHDPNLAYYCIPPKEISTFFGYRRNPLGETDSIEDERGMFHYPLHRAVLWNSVELVELLLKHGADPHAIDGRSNTPLAVLIRSDTLIDSVIVESLVNWGADKNAALHIACQGEYEWDHGPKIKWPVVKTLLRLGADLKKALTLSENSFINVITECGRGEHMETSYEILGEFLDSGLEANLLIKAFEKILLSLDCARSDTVRKLTILLEVGVPFDYAIGERKGFDGQGQTPLQLQIVRLDAGLSDISRSSRPRKLFTELLGVTISWLWILVRAGAQLKMCDGSDISVKLMQLEHDLDIEYENSQFFPREASPDLRRSDAVLGHLGLFKEVMTWLRTFHPRSLFDLSVVAVRRSLGLYPGPKLRSMGIPQLLQDAVLLKDLRPFVEKAERCLFLHLDDFTPSDILSTSSDEFDFSDDSEVNSDEDVFWG